MIWSDKSEYDFDEIWNYTREQWAENQADKYLVGIYALVSDPHKRFQMARKLDYVRPGRKRVRYVRHYVNFYDRKDSFYIDRVLHVSMDETLHLP